MTMKKQPEKSVKTPDWAVMEIDAEEWRAFLLKRVKEENEKYKDKPPVMTVSD